MPITDSFSGTEGDGITVYSSNWAYVVGSGINLQIHAAGFASSGTGAVFAARRTEGSFPADHYAQIVLEAADSANTHLLGVSVRGGDNNCYGFTAWTVYTYLWKIVGGTWTQLGSNGAGVVNNDVIKLTVAGTTLTPAVNGSTQNPPGAQTDTSLPTGAPGIAGENATGTLGSHGDAFEGTDVTPGSVARVSNFAAQPMIRGPM